MLKELKGGILMSTIHFEMHQKKMDREMNKYEIGQI